MGLIRAVAGAMDSVLQEQWKEFISCDAMGQEILLRRAHKTISDGGANSRRNDNVLTNGSLLVVADGQCVIVTSQGRIVDVCSEPGEHIFIDPNRPGGVKGFFRDVWERVGFGGEDVQPVTHRVYYVNLLEIMGNPFVTPAPIPFRISDKNIPVDADLSVMIEGMYSYRVSDPVKLYKAMTGNVASAYSRSGLQRPMTSALLTALQSALPRLGDSGLRPHSLPEHIPELTKALRDAMEKGWAGEHGLELCSIAVSSLKVMNAAGITVLQRVAVFRDPTMAAAHLTGAAADAMQAAAANPGSSSGQQNGS